MNNYDEVFLDPVDGRLQRLRVQGENPTPPQKENHDQYPDCAWERHGINVVRQPLLLSLVNWMVCIDDIS